MENMKDISVLHTHTQTVIGKSQILSHAVFLECNILIWNISQLKAYIKHSWL